MRKYLIGLGIGIVITVGVGYALNQTVINRHHLEQQT